MIEQDGVIIWHTSAIQTSISFARWAFSSSTFCSFSEASAGISVRSFFHYIAYKQTTMLTHDPLSTNSLVF